MNAGGDELVLSGGSTVSTTVFGNGSQVVRTSGVASDTIVSSGGEVAVSSGGSAVSAMIGSGGTQTVRAGGAASFSIVGNGGFEVVSAGGRAVSTTVENGGSETVARGATTGTIIDSGGVETLSSGGTTSLTVLNSGGEELLSAGGFSFGTVVNGGGIETVSAGGTADNSIVESGGLLLLSGGNASGATVGSGGLVIVLAAKTTGNVVASGGVEIVSSGGTASNTKVDSGGYLIVLRNTTVQGTVNSGGTVVTTGVELYQPGVGFTDFGATAISAMVASGGTEFVLGGGTASFTTVSSGGTALIFSGGTARDTTLGSGGIETVSAHGSAVGTTVNSGGFQFVFSSGPAISTSVDSSGTESVSSGGTVSFTTVGGGGLEVVSTGGRAFDTRVGSGGFEIVSSGGVASFTTVGNGGLEVVSAGGRAIDTTVGSGGVEVLLGVDGISGTASGTTLDLGGAIDIAYLTLAGDGTATVDSSTDVLSVTEGAFSYTQQLAGTYLSTDSFTLLPGSDEFTGGTQVELTSTLCFCIDTLIATPTGQVKVQDLAVGDLVMTLRGVARPITWVGIGAVLATRGRRSAATPVIVHKGALADNVPTHDLRVTRGHSLYIDHVLIPVEFLVNHRSIEWDDRAQEVKLFHIELETHDVLIANGAPAESYRDDGNRWLFRNANGGWAHPPQEPCAPVLTGGKLVDQAWQRLLDRAGPRPGLPLTEDADLHLVVDGQRLDAKSCLGETLVFRLMARPETVRIVSRGGAPQELGVARDPRVLGVALWRITLRQGPRLRMIEAEDASLAEGFHGYEADNSFRWTDGDALLPAALYDGLQGGFELDLQVACSARYGDDRQARAAA